MTGKRYQELNALRTIYAQALWPSTMRKKQLPTELRPLAISSCWRTESFGIPSQGKYWSTVTIRRGVDRKCVANFLRKTVAGTTGENKIGSVSEKAVKPTSKSSKPTSARVTPSRPKKESSERPFSSPFFDQGKTEQQMNEDAWEDAGKRFPGLQ